MDNLLVMYEQEGKDSTEDILKAQARVRQVRREQEEDAAAEKKDRRDKQLKKEIQPKQEIQPPKEIKPEQQMQDKEGEKTERKTKAPERTPEDAVPGAKTSKKKKSKKQAPEVVEEIFSKINMPRLDAAAVHNSKMIYFLMFEIIGSGDTVTHNIYTVLALTKLRC